MALNLPPPALYPNSTGQNRPQARSYQYLSDAGFTVPVPRAGCCGPGWCLAVSAAPLQHFSFSSSPSLPPRHTPRRFFFAVSTAPQLRLLCFETVFVYVTLYFSKIVPKPIENCIYTQDKPSQPTAFPPTPGTSASLQPAQPFRPVPQVFGGHCTTPGELTKRDAPVEERRSCGGQANRLVTGLTS